MTTNTKKAAGVKWYRAAEAKKGRTIHLAGHSRLGASFAKCGKTLGRVVPHDAGIWNPCAACAIEQNKEIEREKKRVEMEAKSPSIPYPKTPELDRMAAVKDKSHEIGRFLDWLEEKELLICVDGTDGFYPRRGTKEALLAEFFEINLNKVENERRAILDAFRGAR